MLRKLNIGRTNQVRTSDICSIPMAKGFMFLTVIMDWHSRRVQAWQISNTLETNACVEALEEALLRYGAPEIFNTDHGAQFTSEVFPAMLKAYEVKISMEGSRWALNAATTR